MTLAKKTAGLAAAKDPLVIRAKARALKNVVSVESEKKRPSRAARAPPEPDQKGEVLKEECARAVIPVWNALRREFRQRRHHAPNE